MIYHIPGRAAVNMTADTIVRIADAAPNLVGIKHAFNDLALVSDLIARLGEEFRIHVGLEDLSFPMVCLGAHGLMNAVGNLLPGKVQELYSATAAGDLARGRALHYELCELNQAIFFDMNPIPMKYMMKRIGILPNEVHRLPMVPATPELAGETRRRAAARGNDLRNDGFCAGRSIVRTIQDLVDANHILYPPRRGGRIWPCQHPSSGRSRGGSSSRAAWRRRW